MQQERLLRSGLRLRKVIGSDGTVENFDHNRIIDSLVLELDLDCVEAERVTDLVVSEIRDMKDNPFFASDIRHMVIGALRCLDFTEEAKKYSKIGLSAYDITNIMTLADYENANVGENPESISGHIAGAMIKEYTLRVMFDRGERDAHTKGLIHVHDLDYFPMRPFCFGIDARDVLRFGLPPVRPWSDSCVSVPANKPMVAVLHLAKWLGCLTTEFSGGLGYDIVNIVLAPYLAGLNVNNPSTIRLAEQISQCLVYEISQLFISRKGQSPFSSIMIYPEIPDEWASVPAVVPGGKYAGVYGDYSEQARLLFNTIVDVFRHRDGDSKPFNFPKLEVAWKKKWDDAGLYNDVYALALESGAPCLVNLDVLSAGTKTQCCRMALKGDKIVKYCSDKHKIDPENSQRMGSLQTVTLNLPMAAAKSRSTGEDINSCLEEQFYYAEKILMKKRALVEDLLRRNTVLRFCSAKCDDRQYLDIETSHLSIGFVGLNEAVELLTGQELHSRVSKDAVKSGDSMLKHIEALCIEASEKCQCLFSTWEAPAESCAGRLANLTLQKYPDTPVCGENSPFFTNSDHVRYDAETPLYNRIDVTEHLQRNVDGGTIFHAFIGEKKPEIGAFKEFIRKILERGIKYLAITFDYTTCDACGSFFRGDQNPCPNCGSDNTNLWSRVTGYFSRVKRYNAAKYEEWKGRQRTSL